MGLERTIGRLLAAGTLVGVVALGLGVVAMLATGVSPLDRPFPPFDVSAVPRQILRLEPAGFLWIGLAVVIATPALRVGAALFGYLGRGERPMALIAMGILAVIGLGILIGIGEA